MLIPTAGPTQGTPPLCSPLPRFPLLLLSVFLTLLLAWPTAGHSAEIRPETTEPGAFSASAEVLPTPADFDDCVRLALRQSPFFTKSSLEIQVRKLDEADSKSDFFPSLYFTSRYYPSQPNNPSVTDPLNYYVAFSTGDYNPLVAYLSLKAKKVITKIARLAHLKAISLGLEKLGKAFLELKAAKRLEELQETYILLARENLRSARERQKLGEVVPMEVEIISQELAVAKTHRKGLKDYQARIREGIRQFLDLNPEQPLQLDLRHAHRQILGDFEPARASLIEARQRAFDVRIKQLSQKLQTWNITLSKMKFMPSFQLVLQTPDPVSSTINRGTFFSFGLKFPIFQGFKRLRDIKRQKIILRQFASEEDVEAAELTQDWREVEGDLNNAATDLQVAQAEAKLARLKEGQAETLYRTGEMDFTAFMKARRERVEAEIKVTQKALEYDLAAVELRNLTGELVDPYVHKEEFLNK